jgi:hypothetical protein
MTDGDLQRIYKLKVAEYVYEPQSESGIRTRRRELTDMKMVKPVGKTTNENGRPVIIWGLRDDLKQQESLFDELG